MVRRVNLLVAGMIAAVSISTYLFASQAQAKPDLKPWCSNSGSMPAEKFRLLQAKECAQPSPTAKPKPYVPPMREYQMETATGILNEGGYVHTPLAKGKYTVVNVWADRNFVIYAGALESDSAQGVVFIENQSGPEPLFVGEIRSSGKDGALRFVKENGALLTLEAANGTVYTFNAKDQTLSRM